MTTRRLKFALLAAALVVSTVILMADQAGAHKATLSVTTSCQQDGRWTAAWELSNSEARKTMDIEEEDVTDLTPNPTPYSGTSRDTTTHANTVAQVTAHVTVDWVRHEPIDYSVTAHRPDVCHAPTTTTTPTTTPTTTTTVPATTTTVPPAGLIPPLVIERPRPALPVETTVRFTG